MIFAPETPAIVKDGASVFMGMVATTTVLLFLVFLYLNRRVSLSLPPSVSLAVAGSLAKKNPNDGNDQTSTSEELLFEGGRPRCIEPNCPECCFRAAVQNDGQASGRPGIEGRTTRALIDGGAGLEGIVGRGTQDGCYGRGNLGYSSERVGRSGGGVPGTQYQESSIASGNLERSNVIGHFSRSGTRSGSGNVDCEDLCGGGGRVSPSVRSTQSRPARSAGVTHQASFGRSTEDNKVHALHYGTTKCQTEATNGRINRGYEKDHSLVPHQYHTPPPPHRQHLYSHHHIMPGHCNRQPVSPEYCNTSNSNEINGNVRFSIDTQGYSGQYKQMTNDNLKHQNINETNENGKVCKSDFSEERTNVHRLCSPNDHIFGNESNKNVRVQQRSLQRITSYDPTMTRAKPSLQYPYYSSLHEPEPPNLNEVGARGLDNRKNFHGDRGIQEENVDIHTSEELITQNSDHHQTHDHHGEHHALAGRSSPSGTCKRELSQPGTSTGALTAGSYSLSQPGTSTGALTAGLGGSSSASSCASTSSGDDDLMAHRSLRHRDPKGYQGHTGPGPSPAFQTRDDALFPRENSSLEVSLAYDTPTRILTAHVLQAKGVPDRDSGAAANSQVRILLVPNRRQKHKTRIRQGSTPQFNEAFIFRKISPDEVLGLSLRFRLYECQRIRRERLLGEALVPLSSVNLHMANSLWLPLESGATCVTASDEVAEVCSLPRSDSTGSNHSVHGAAPGLLVGLTYNGTTGRLAVEIIKGSHFRTSEDSSSIANPRAPDSLVKIRLTSSSGQEIATAKTTIRRGQPNPLFKETFIFQVALFQLPDVTLLLAVYARKSMKRKDMIGWCSLGSSSSGEEELAHWNAMRDGGQSCRWHSLHLN